jgi:serine protease DegS
MQTPKARKTMTGREFGGHLAFIAACIAAGVAIALFSARFFPHLVNGGAAPVVAATPAPASAAAPPAAPAAPPRPAGATAAADGASVPAAPMAPSNARPARFEEVLAPSAGALSYAAAVRVSAPAVVNVYTRAVVTERLPAMGIEQFFGGPVQPRYRQRVQNALGSGVLVDAKGHIVTNNHVIEGATQIRVQLADGRSADATVVGRDRDTDLAVLRIGIANVPVMRLGRSDTLQVGDVVLAIGNPLGLSQTVTHGIVSAKERAQLGVSTYESFIQTDAAINEGNSGGALVNARGELVGINTAVLGKKIGAEGIGVAIPVELVRGVLQEIIAHGRVIRGWIGITPYDVNERMAQLYGLPVGAVVVASVAQGSPAAEAGLRPGDIVVSIEGREVRNAQDTMAQIARREPGASVKLVALRREQKLALTVPVRDPQAAP